MQICFLLNVNYHDCQMGFSHAVTHLLLPNSIYTARMRQASLTCRYRSQHRMLWACAPITHTTAMKNVRLNHSNLYIPDVTACMTYYCSCSTRRTTWKYEYIQITVSSIAGFPFIAYFVYLQYSIVYIWKNAKLYQGPPANITSALVCIMGTVVWVSWIRTKSWKSSCI